MNNASGCILHRWFLQSVESSRDTFDFMDLIGHHHFLGGLIEMDFILIHSMCGFDQGVFM